MRTLALACACSHASVCEKFYSLADWIERYRKEQSQRGRPKDEIEADLRNQLAELKAHLAQVCTTIEPEKGPTSILDGA